mgnify:CR=1 FL=1
MRAIPCEVYSRIVGYFRPVRQWNKGKMAEYADRRVYAFVADEEAEDETDRPVGKGKGADSSRCS